MQFFVQHARIQSQSPYTPQCCKSSNITNLVVWNCMTYVLQLGLWELHDSTMRYVHYCVHVCTCTHTSTLSITMLQEKPQNTPSSKVMHDTCAAAILQDNACLMLEGCAVLCIACTHAGSSTYCTSMLQMQPKNISSIMILHDTCAAAG